VVAGTPSFLAKLFDECLPLGVSRIFNNFRSTGVKEIFFCITTIASIN
jgi:hypothetical protein